MERPLPAYRGEKPYVFISYSHKDQRIVNREIGWLQSQGVNVWYDEGISAGSEWSEALGSAIKNCTTFIYFVTPNSVVSENCRRELNFALEEERTILAAHLQKTELSDGLKLNLNNRQAIFMDHRPAEFRTTMLEFVGSNPKKKVSEKPINRHPLRRYAIAIGFISLVTGIWLYALRETSDEQPLIHKGGAQDHSIAVIPFENLSLNSENEYLAAGLSDELMFALGVVPGLRVAPRTSSYHLKKTKASLATIGETLHVRYVLEGSLRRTGEDVRVLARLIEVDSGEAVAKMAYDRKASDLIQLERDLATEIVDALAPQLSKTEIQSAQWAGTNDERAFDLYLQGNAAIRSDNAQDMNRAKEFFAAAIEIDPRFFRAYGGLSQATARAGFRNGNFEQAYSEWREIQQQLDILDPEQVRPGIDRSKWAEAFLDRDWPTAEHITQRALRRSPTDPIWLEEYANLLAHAGLFEASLDYFLLAREWDPFEPDAVEGVGNMFLALGRFTEAVTAYERCLQIAPARSGCWGQLFTTWITMGDDDKVRAYFDGSLPRASECLLTRQEQVCVPPPEQMACPTCMGYMYSAYDMDAAYTQFFKAVDLPFSNIHQIRWQQHKNNGIDLDPRYKLLLEKVGLTDEWQAELCQRARRLTPVTGVTILCGD